VPLLANFETFCDYDAWVDPSVDPLNPVTLLENKLKVVLHVIEACPDCAAQMCG
jgi:hypothetical protein